MKVSLRWLGRHVDLDGLGAQEIAEALTRHSAEVEGVESVFEALDGLVVGEVLDSAPHPDADRLSLNQVAVGEGDALPIVCGAPNVAAGQRVAVAVPGTVLPDGTKLKKSKIRGQVSMGMILSERELGLSEEHDGILVLDPDASVGGDVTTALGLEDWALEIDNKSLTHRPDLWGHRGIAREVAALFGRSLIPLDEAPAPAPGEGWEVTVEDEEGCPVYAAQLFEGVDNGPSPLWLRALLAAMDQQTLGRLVDATSFVLFDLGQPTHVFDLGALGGDGIVVRRARAGESLLTLDDETADLEADDLVICAGERPVALAGVIGGQETGVGDQTDRVLLESANFEASSVRRTGQRLGIATDARTRFEKGQDPHQAAAGVERFAWVIDQVCEGARRIGSPVVVGDAERSRPPVTVSLRGDRLRSVLGMPVTDDEAADALGRLGFPVSADQGTLDVTVPPARAGGDVMIEEDLIEEVARLVGYERIPRSAPMRPAVPVPHDPVSALGRMLEDRLVLAWGFSEAMTYNFVEASVLDALGADALEHMHVTNPQSPTAARLRRDVAASLLPAAGPNLRERVDVRLFERGQGVRPGGSDEPVSVHQIACVWASRSGRGGWRDEPYARAQALGLDLAAASGLRPDHAGVILEEGAGDGAPWFHGVRSGRLVADSGWAVRFGELDSRVAAGLGLKGRAAVVEADVEVLAAAGADPVSYEVPPRYPDLRVDVAVAVPESVRAGEVADLLAKASRGKAASVDLFDIYRGEPLEDGLKSLAYHVVLRAGDRTLEAKDEASFLGRAARAVAEVEGEVRQ